MYEKAVKHMTSETNKKTKELRYERFIKAMYEIMLHPAEHSFWDLIDNRGDIFEGFKLIYSTNHSDGESGVISLNKIEDECPVLKTNFYGNGLLFFSDNIYDESKKNGTAKIAIDYSLSFDKNTAEKFRIWEGGGSLDKSLGDFEKLVRFIKDVDFNFDYSFCLIEDYVNLMQEHNDRPFNTIRALKRFDHLDYDKKLFDINNPRFSENRIDAGVRAMVTLDTFRSSPEIKEAQLRRLVVYIVLLKAVIIRQKKNVELKDQLYKLVRFCLTNLGKITKTELYVAWKLLKYGS